MARANNIFDLLIRSLFLFCKINNLYSIFDKTVASFSLICTRSNFSTWTSILWSLSNGHFLCVTSEIFSVVVMARSKVIWALTSLIPFCSILKVNLSRWSLCQSILNVVLAWSNSYYFFFRLTNSNSNFLAIMSEILQLCIRDWNSIKGLFRCLSALFICEINSTDPLFRQLVSWLNVVSARS